jgi:hypothetical protein
MPAFAGALAIVFPKFHRRTTAGALYIIDIVWFPEHCILPRAADFVFLHGFTSA